MDSREKPDVEIADYFDMRADEVQKQLDAVESGRILRLEYVTAAGAVDFTEPYKEQLRRNIRDYKSAGEKLRPAPTATFPREIR